MIRTIGRRPFLLATLALATACGAPGRTVVGPRVSGERIAVMEFSTEGTRVAYSEPHETFGLALAEEVAEELRKRHHDAVAVPAGGTLSADVIVNGRMTRIDGCSRALRYWVGFGTGAAVFGAQGEVSKTDGTRMATFWDEHASGWGVFGGASSTLLQKCLKRTGAEIAKMVDSGNYQQAPTP